MKNLFVRGLGTLMAAMYVANLSASKGLLVGTPEWWKFNLIGCAIYMLFLFIATFFDAIFDTID